MSKIPAFSESVLDGIAPSELVKMIGNVDLADAGQAETAISVVNTMVSGGMNAVSEDKAPTIINGSIYPTPAKASTSTTTSTTESAAAAAPAVDDTEETGEEEQLVDTMEKYLRLVRKMTDVSRLPATVYPHEYNVRMGISQSVGESQ